MENLQHLARIPTGISYLLRQQRVWGQPVFFTIETINSCNFQCVYCPQSVPDKHFVNGRGVMSLENFKRIIANLRSAFDVSIVSLHRDGEPLLNAHLEDYIAHLRQWGTCVTLSSNCSLLSEVRAQSLVASGLSLITTDFCADPHVYESLRKRGNWEQTLAGLRSLLNAAAKAKAKFRLIVKDLATDGVDAAQAKALMEKTAALFPEQDGRLTIIAAQLHNALGASLMSTQPITVDTSGGNRFPYDMNPDRTGRFGSYSLCHQPWVNLTVDFAGRVVACCRDLRSQYVVGDLLREPAGEIWNGERMRFLRGALAAKRPQQINICATCDMPRRGSCSGRTPVERIRNFFLSAIWERRRQLD